MSKYVINPVTLLYEVKEDPKSYKYIRLALLFLAALAFVCFSFWLYTSVLKLDLPKTAMLKRRHAEWEARIDMVRSQIEAYGQVLKGIEDRDDDVYRSIYGLNEIPDEVKYSGLEGVNRYDMLAQYGANAGLSKTVRDMDILTKRAYIQSRALDELGEMARKAGDMVSCVPSVPPLAPLDRGYKLSSGFGYRTDPVYGGSEMHTGQDFAHPLGSPVFATGDGVVEKASFQFGGYGNEVIVNHGYGYRTRYAHLSTIIVNEGMAVKRADQIGTVGNTGKSTGPHLHYEVEYRGNRVNPRNYMDLDIPLDEYRAMVLKRVEESPNGKKISTSEILNRRRHSYE